MSPEVRVAVRALIAGLLSFAASLQASGMGSDIQSGEFVAAILAGLVAAGTLAAAEFGTPINPTVGKGAEPS